MPDIAILILIVIIVVTCIVLVGLVRGMLAFDFYPSITFKQFIISESILLPFIPLLLIWLTVAYNTTNILEEKVFDIKTIKQEEISYQAIIENYKVVVNITKELGMILPENTKVKRTVNNPWAYGVYKMDTTVPKYKIIDIEK